MSHTAREGLDLPSTYFNCKSPILDRRLKALKYSETFKISSRAEASVVLKLTQQLNDRLEQYFLNCKGLEVKDSKLADNMNQIYETSTKILPTSDYGNRKLEDGAISHVIHSGGFKEKVLSGLESRKLQKFEDPNEIPFMSTQSCIHGYEEPPKPIPVEVFPSQSCSATSPYYSYTTESNNFNAQSDLGVENNESDFDASSLHSSSAQELPSSSQAQSKTSKTLSPDILQLLKGKDANTVTNILKTLSPFYPALQDVNLEILAQVLVNTGALD